MGKVIYLDNNATSQCAPEVLVGMLPFFSSQYANPASSHILGRNVAQHIHKARCQVAASLHCDPSEVIFTSGATESNNLALLGLTRAPVPTRRRVLVAATEHKSVLAPSELLREAGFTVERVSVDSDGKLRVDVLRETIGTDVLVVSVHAANNEVGTIQPIKEVAEIAHAVGAIVHCDAAQALGKIDFRVHDLGVDLASFSGHKVYGPKGVGVLFAASGLAGQRLMPVFGGGGHEFGFRPGTLNVPAIVGMGLACELAQSRLSVDMSEIAGLRERFEQGILQAVPGVWVNGRVGPRLPGTSNITVEGVAADALVANVPEVCISAGSACTSGSIAPSLVLLAMGLSQVDAECSVRASLGRYTTRDDIDCAVAQLVAGILTLRMQMR